MAQDLESQIYKNFNQEETETLLEIWETNNRSEWSDLAFEILREILQERMDEVPPQNIQTSVPKKFEKGFLEKAIEWFSEDNEKNEYPENWAEADNPAFYDPQEALKLYQWLNKLAKAMIPVSILLGLVTFPQIFDIAQSYFINSLNDMTLVIWLFTLVSLAVGIALQIISTYYPLKALAYILKILMQFEHNSRK